MDDFLEFEGAKDMKDLFENILGSKVNIKDNIDDTEEKVFTSLVERLITQTKLENNVYSTSGLELASITNNLWVVTENLLKLLYGVEATEVIMWYIIMQYEKEELDDSWEEEMEDGIDSIKKLWETVKRKMDRD